MQRARHDAPALRAARRRLPQRQVSARQAAAEGRAARLQQPPRRPTSSTSGTGTSPTGCATSQRGPDRSLLDIAFGWLLARPVTASVIAGAMTPEQIEQNVRAGSVKLLGRRRRRTRPDHAVGMRHEQAARPHHRRFGRRPVRRQHAAQHRLGHDRVRAQRRGACRPRRRHQHASAIARRHQAARHPVRQFDGHRGRQRGVPRSRRPRLRPARHRAADELLGPGVPLAARSDPGRKLSSRQVARAGRAGRRAASPRSSPTARASAAIC